MNLSTFALQETAQTIAHTPDFQVLEAHACDTCQESDGISAHALRAATESPSGKRISGYASPEFLLLQQKCVMAEVCLHSHSSSP